jgi:hypothetical protein
VGKTYRKGNPAIVPGKAHAGFAGASPPSGYAGSVAHIELIGRDEILRAIANRAGQLCFQ